MELAPFLSGDLRLLARFGAALSTGGGRWDSIADAARNMGQMGAELKRAHRLTDATREKAEQLYDEAMSSGKPAFVDEVATQIEHVCDDRMQSEPKAHRLLPDMKALRRDRAPGRPASLLPRCLPGGVLARSIVLHDRIVRERVHSADMHSRLRPPTERYASGSELLRALK